MVSDEVGKRCRLCKNSIKVYKKLVKGQLHETIVRTYVDCKIEGTRLAISMKNHSCKDYDLKNRVYTLDMENWEWVLKEED